MSVKLNVARLGVLAGATVMIAACQDAISSLAPSVDTSTAVRMSRGVGSRKDVIPDHYIVVLRDGVIDVRDRSKSLIAKTNGNVRNTFAAGIKGFSARLTASEAASLRLDPNVAYVEEDQIVTVGAGKPTTGGGGSKGGGKGGKTTAAPVDSGTFIQTAPPSWGLDRIDQTLIPLNSKYTYTATGAGVHVYIIDSGIRSTHVEFGGRASLDTSFVDDGYGATGCNWHGTHVAATVGGITAGVAKAVRLHSVRILDCNAAGSVSGAIAGIDWVIANRVSPAIINLSVAAPSSQALTDAVDRAVAAGVMVVAAAGNNAADACGYSPANAASAITVGATNSGDQQAEYSNFGSCIDIMAPGDAIMSASAADNTSLQYGSGTSMAAPHVTGAAALYLEINPSATASEAASALLERSTVGLIGNLGFATPNRLLRTR
jgi:subtilisin family serine protease